MKDYVRVKVKLPSGKTRTVWAIKSLTRYIYVNYSVVNKHGEWTGELIIADPKDIIKEDPAWMSNKYAMLEIDCCFERREFGECRCIFQSSK